MSLNRFVGKNVLITGAGSGIGRGIALRFAQEGAKVAIHDVNVEGAEETAQMMREQFNADVTVYPVDITVRQEVIDAIEKTYDDFGKLDVLVANAGINKYCNIFDFTDDDWDKIIAVNLTGAWLYDMHVARHMKDQGGGSIVNISSNGAFVSSHKRAPYMASKGGAHMLTMALSQDLGEYGIRVNDVAPGTIRSGMTRPTEPRTGYSSPEMVAMLTALHRYGEPHELAAAVAFLASDEASYITGATLTCDGGFQAGGPLGLNVRPIPQEGYEDEEAWLDEFEYVREYKEMRKNR